MKQPASSVVSRLRRLVNRDETSPLYVQIQTGLEDMIGSGLLRPEERIPGDLELGRSLDIDHRTVRQAYSGLVEKGLIRRIKRAGTFVNGADRRPVPCVGFFYYAETREIMAKRAEYMQRHLMREGFDLKIVAYDEGFFSEHNLMDEVRRRGMKGAVIVPMRVKNCCESLLSLEEAGFPYVRFGNHFYGDVLKSSLVAGNARQRIIIPLEYLWQQEHRKIGLVCNTRDNTSWRAYRDFYAKRGGTKDKWILDLGYKGPPQPWENFFDPGSANEYLKRNPELTAVLVEHPLFCSVLLQRAIGSGRRVPLDLSLLSAYEWDGLLVTDPPVTAMSLSSRKMAETAAMKVLALLGNRESEKSADVLLDYQLVQRQSVASPRRAA